MMDMRDMRDKIAAEHDRIIHATIDEPCSYKRSVFRAGWDAHKAALIAQEAAQAAEGVE